MEPIELLKKLKNIKPDSDYSRKSRLVVLSHGSTHSTSSGQAPLAINKENRLPVFSFSFYGEQRRTIKQVAAGVLRSGWAMALTAIFLFLTIGSFSVLKILSPATTAVVDLTGLKAEAQAIDAQIELTNVVYSASVGIENKTSTSSIIIPRETKSPKAAAKQAEDGVKSNATGLAEDESAQPTIDSALDILSR